MCKLGCPPSPGLVSTRRLLQRTQTGLPVQGRPSGMPRSCRRYLRSSWLKQSKQVPAKNVPGIRIEDLQRSQQNCGSKSGTHYASDDRLTTPAPADTKRLSPAAIGSSSVRPALLIQPRRSKSQQHNEQRSNLIPAARPKKRGDDGQTRSHRGARMSVDEIRRPVAVETATCASVRGISSSPEIVALVRSAIWKKRAVERSSRRELPRKEEPSVKHARYGLSINSGEIERIRLFCSIFRRRTNPAVPGPRARAERGCPTKPHDAILRASRRLRSTGRRRLFRYSQIGISPSRRTFFNRARAANRGRPVPAGY